MYNSAFWKTHSYVITATIQIKHSSFIHIFHALLVKLLACSAPGKTDLFVMSIVLPVTAWHRDGIIHMVVFYIWYFHLVWCKFINVKCTKVCAFILLSNFLLSEFTLYECTTVDLSLHHLKNIWVICSFWLLWIKPLKYLHTGPEENVSFHFF